MFDAGTQVKIFLVFTVSLSPISSIHKFFFLIFTDIFKFDNTYSWFTDKLVTFDVNVALPTDDFQNICDTKNIDEPQLENNTTQMTHG